MSLTYSSMLDLDTNFIEFDLINTLNNENFKSVSLDNKPILIMFICNHCPYVIHYHDEIKKLNDDYSNQINMIAISSNDAINYPQDGPNEMKEMWKKLKISFPYLYDETQEIAKAYKAECTPEFYLFNEQKRLVYRGRFDETSPGSNQAPHGSDLRKAIACMMNNQKISTNQFPSMGCNIKWK